jgi:hypothetical protein
MEVHNNERSGAGNAGVCGQKIKGIHNDKNHTINFIFFQRFRIITPFFSQKNYFKFNMDDLSLLTAPAEQITFAIAPAPYPSRGWESVSTSFRCPLFHALPYKNVFHKIRRNLQKKGKAYKRL